MKRLALLATTALFAAGATNAAEMTSIITDSVQMTVTPQVTITTPMAETYSVTGVGVNATTLGSVNNDGVGTYSVTGTTATTSSSNLFGEGGGVIGGGGGSTTTTTTTSDDFQFSESYMPFGSSVTQTQTAGSSAGMTGSISPTTGLATGTPGGPGSNIILQRSLELTVIQ
jgi:hypothetical protein